MKRWLILVLFAGVVYASTSQPFCEIDAEVLSIMEGNADIKVLEVVAETKSGEEAGYSCADLYQGKTVENVWIEDGEIEEGMFINGVITYFGDVSSGGYSIAGIKEIEPILKDEKDDSASFWPRLTAVILFLLISMTATAFIILKRHRGEL